MIKFEGKLSPKCQKFIKSKKTKRLYLIFIAIFLLISAVHIANIVITGSMISFFVIVFNAFIFGVWPIIYVRSIDQRTYIPRAIMVNAELEKIFVECKKRKSDRDFSAVKKIIDYGEWYRVMFPFDKCDESFVIQKDLLTEGTLEEFENLFLDKVVPAKKKTN